MNFPHFLKFLSSLRLAVVVLVTLTVALMVGTILESVYDIPTARFWVYRATWFRLTLFLLGLNILFVALSRRPWKKKHFAFLLAHAGILAVLIGSFLTDRFGLDGQLILSEGETSPYVELESQSLVVRELLGPKIYEIPWVPPHSKFRPVRIQDYGLEVVEFLPHAEKRARYEATKAGEQGYPALLLKLQGGPLGFSQEHWLYGGDPQTSMLSIGPAEIVLLPKGMPFSSLAPGQLSPTRLELSVNARGGLSYRVFSRSSSPRDGRVAHAVKESEIETGWMKNAPRFSGGPLKLVLKKMIPSAVDRSDYEAARVLYGTQAPPGAIRIKTAQGNSQWVGYGERRRMDLGGAYGEMGSTKVEVEFVPQYVVLPYSVKLLEFKILNYEGTMDPQSYQSRVEIEGIPGVREISMNEPLEHKGITLYQSSFIPGQPRPVTTVLSVNRDPGRGLKYLGCILIVSGCIALFAQKYKQQQSQNQRRVA